MNTMKYDLILRNGIIVDGTGSPPFKADVGIVSDSITKIGDLTSEDAERIINVDNLIVAPGFIDIHNHSDLSIFLVPTADNYIMQGVTTLVVGNCGFSPAPISDLNKEFIEYTTRPFWGSVRIDWSSFREYLDRLDELKKSVNIVTLVGHGTIRSATLGVEDREPNERELNIMKEYVKEAMEAGAFGLSTGLIYVPGVYAKTDEIIELAKVASRYGGIYATHMRNEGERLIDSIIETIRIGIEANIPVEISHLKAAGRPNWGMIENALKLIEYYADKGFDISADAYPYTASSTTLASIFPPWALEGGIKNLLKKFKDSEFVSRVRRELESKGLMGGRWIEWRDISISYSETHKEIEGMFILDIARKWTMDPLDAVIKLLLDDSGSTAMIIYGLNQDDVDKAITHPYVAIGSDGSVKELGKGKPHPRNYGTFPRIIADYVRERKLLKLSEAIRKMTSLPARKLRIWDRGILRPGMKADIVVFNMHLIKDEATFEDPHRYPKGIRYVLVNGSIVVDDERHTLSKPGRLITRVESEK